jgi:hypothetical protein
MAVSLLCDAPCDANALSGVFIEFEGDMFTRSNGYTRANAATLLHMYDSGAAMHTFTPHDSDTPALHRAEKRLVEAQQHAGEQRCFEHLVSHISARLEQLEACKRTQHARAFETRVDNEQAYHTLMSTPRDDLERWANAELAARVNARCHMEDYYDNEGGGGERATVIQQQQHSGDLSTDPRREREALRLLYRGIDKGTLVQDDDATHANTTPPLFNGNADMRAQVEVLYHSSFMSALYQRVMQLERNKTAESTLTRLRTLDEIHTLDALPRDHTLPVVVLFSNLYRMIYVEAWLNEMFSHVSSSKHRTPRRAVQALLTSMCSNVREALQEYTERVDHHALLVVNVNCALPPDIALALRRNGTSATPTAEEFERGGGLPSLRPSALRGFEERLREVLVDAVAHMLSRMTLTTPYEHAMQDGAYRQRTHSVCTHEGLLVDYTEDTPRRVSINIRSPSSHDERSLLITAPPPSSSSSTAQADRSAELLKDLLKPLEQCTS